MFVKIKVEKEVHYLKCELGVRYWEDAVVNGKDENENNPTIPFATKSQGTWNPIIMLNDGRILNWPIGVTASTHYKVCDAGVYTLLDENRCEVVSKDGYVPDMLCPDGNGFGDYVELEIDENGFIKNFKADLSYFDEDEE